MFLGDQYELQSVEMSQRGYRVFNSTNIPLHDDIEDTGCSFTTDSGATVNILADGHGGPGAALFFTGQMKKSLMSLLDSAEWDLNNPQDRTRLEDQLSLIFIQLDSEYLKLKCMEFKNWFPSDASAKPKDDGMYYILILRVYNDCEYYSKWISGQCKSWRL